jgi:tetratricopeptide (TPR) repeat protein
MSRTACRTQAALALIAALLFLLASCSPSRKPANPSTPPTELNSASRYHYERGLEHARAGRPEEAARAWETAVALDPTFAPAYFALVDQAVAAGNLRVALMRLRTLRAANPTVKHVECTQSSLLFQNGQTLQAMRAAQEAVRREPECPQAHSMLGMTQLACGQREQGVASLQTAHRLAPNDEPIALTLAQSLAQTGRVREALQIVLPRVQRQDASVQSLYLYAWILSERSDRKPTEYRESLQTLERALQQDPGHLASRALQGMLLARLGQDAQARPLLEESVRAGATPENLRALAAIYERAKDRRAPILRRQAAQMQAARRQIMQARARYLRHPDDPNSIVQLARLEARSKNVGDAQALLQEALRQSPNHPEALELFHALRAASSGTPAP